MVISIPKYCELDLSAILGGGVGGDGRQLLGNESKNSVIEKPKSGDQYTYRR